MKINPTKYIFATRKKNFGGGGDKRTKVGKGGNRISIGKKTKQKPKGEKNHVARAQAAVVEGKNDFLGERTKTPTHQSPGKGKRLGWVL